MEISFRRQAKPPAPPSKFAKRLIQQGGARGFACHSNGHNQWSASKMNKFPKTVKPPNKPALQNTERRLAIMRRLFFRLANSTPGRPGNYISLDEEEFR